MSKPVVASYCSIFLKPEMLHVYRQVTGLRRFETFVVTKERTEAERFPFHDIEILPPRPRSNFLLRFYFKHIRRLSALHYRGELRILLKLLEPRQVDLMHIYFGHTGVHLLPFIQGWDKPCLVSFHGADVMPREDRPEYIGQMRELLQTVPLVLARSNSLVERLLALGCPKEKIRLNRTGIPLGEFPFFERSAPKDGAWRFVQACRFIAKKGLTTTLRAFALFLKNHPQARLILAGEGPMQEELQRLAGELGIGHAVQMTGFLGQRELCELYHSAHLFVHPSRLTQDSNQEGVPNSMLEAMSTGLPVLATIHGGIPEAVSHGETGLLCAEGDQEALHANMERLTNDVPLWKSMGKVASESVAREFEHGAQIARLEDCYEELLQLHRAGKGAPERP